ncbi:GWxTD domain-containing protein [candidate division KSB1 bacterium]
MRTRLILFLLISLFVTSESSAQTAQEHFQMGIQYFDNGDYKKAEEFFLKATAKNNKFAEAYYYQALCFMKDPTFRNKKKAETALLRARRLEQDSTKYLHALSDVYRSRVNFVSVERVLNERIVKQDSSDMKALEKLSALYRVEGLNYFKRIMSTDDYIIRHGDRQKYVEGKQEEKDKEVRNKKQAKLLTLSDKALDLDPDNPEAIYNKGIVLLDNYRLDEYISYCKEVLYNNPDSKEAHLMLGLGYAEKSDFPLSDYHFQKAIALMDEDEREIYESIDLLKKRADPSSIKDVVSDNSYWLKNDPLWITSFSERKLEHYCRVTEATLRFPNYRAGIPGYKTPRGEKWIKYGRPVETNEVMNLAIGLSAKRYQYWIYEDIVIAFEIRQHFPERGYENSRGLPHFPSTEPSRYEDYMQYKPEGKAFIPYVNILQFSGGGSETDLEIYYGIPLNRLLFELDDGQYYSSYKTGTFLFDESWEKVVEDVIDCSGQFAEAEIDTAADAMAVSRFNTYVTPGSYNFGFEVMDYYSDNTGIFRHSLIVEEFGRDSLQMSSIMLANDIYQIDPGGDVSRHNLEISGNPTHTFRVNQPVHIYFEIYNLFLMNEQGNNSYKVEYAISPTAEDPKGLKKLIDMIWGGPKEEGISVAVDITSTGRDDFQMFRIDNTVSVTGEYIFTIRVTDKTSGYTTERSTPIWIF